MNWGKVELLVCAYVVNRKLESGWSWSRVEEKGKGGDGFRSGNSCSRDLLAYRV